jgi:hypothetical protein
MIIYYISYVNLDQSINLINNGTIKLSNVFVSCLADAINNKILDLIEIKYGFEINIYEHQLEIIRNFDELRVLNEEDEKILKNWVNPNYNHFHVDINLLINSIHYVNNE